MKNVPVGSRGKSVRLLSKHIAILILLVTASWTTLIRAATDANEVWISALDSGSNVGTGETHGNGTITTPYYGDFDFIVNSLPVNTTIHLLPGVFWSKGNQGNSGDLVLKAYHRVIGAGIDTTTIKIDQSSNEDLAQMNLLYSTADGVEIRDLTVDVNASGTEGNAQQAVTLTGNYCKVHRVRAIHTSGNSLCFSVSVGGSRSIISEVEVSSVLGNQCAAISLLSTAGGIVEHCRVSFPIVTTGSPWLRAYVANGTFDALFDGNVSEGGTGGFQTGGFSTSLSETNLTIINSTFRNVLNGITLYKGTGQNVDGVAIRNNTIELSTSAAGNGILAGNTTYYRNIAIAGNTIRTYNNATAASGTYAINANSPVGANYVGLRILDNTIDKSLSFALGAQGTWLADNMDLTGVPLHFRQIGSSSPATVTLDPIDGSVLVSSSSTTTTITLPTASGFSGKEILICNLKATGSLTISSASGQEIWPAGSIYLPAGKTTRLISDGSSKWLQQYQP
jgi:hypothetical protein